MKTQDEFMQFKKWLNQVGHLINHSQFEREAGIGGGKIRRILDDELVPRRLTLQKLLLTAAKLGFKKN